MEKLIASHEQQLDDSGTESWYTEPGGATVARLTDPDRLAAYRDALNNWAVEGYVQFVLNDQAQQWIERNLGKLAHREIGRLMHEYVDAGGEIDEVLENREGWRDLYEFHHDLRFTIHGVAVYIETRLITGPRSNRTTQRSGW